MVHRTGHSLQQHHAFEAKVDEFHEELRGNPPVAQFDILSYLRDWLIHHISIEDAGLRSLTRGRAEGSAETP